MNTILCKCGNTLHHPAGQDIDTTLTASGWSIGEKGRFTCPRCQHQQKTVTLPMFDDYKLHRQRRFSRRRRHGGR